MIQIDPRSSTPIYEQIIQQLKELCLKGIMKPGDKLPSVRELATIIIANPNTVSKAYKELERDGVIETLREEERIYRRMQKRHWLKGR